MSAKKLYLHTGELIDAKQIARMKYPVAPLATIQRLLREGLSVQTILDRNLSMYQQKALRKGQKVSRQVNQKFIIKKEHVS